MNDHHVLAYYSHRILSVSRAMLRESPILWSPDSDDLSLRLRHLADAVAKRAGLDPSRVSFDVDVSARTLRPVYTPPALEFIQWDIRFIVGDQEA